MSEIKLFEVKPEVKECQASEVLLERELQRVIEANMENFFGVRFLASEYAIREGRMDSIGIDENYCPVIFEYKRSVNENVINQGLFYMEWLLDHKANFVLLVQEKLGPEVAKKIDWSFPCVICIASNFTKYDIHSVTLMQRNIKLVKYKAYGETHLLFEYVNTPDPKPIVDANNNADNQAQNNNSELFSKMLENADESTKELYSSLCDYIESLGDDLSKNELAKYVAYRKTSNVFCITVKRKEVLVFVKLDPDEFKDDTFVRDMRETGHWGTGDLKITIQNGNDLKKAEPYLQKAYDIA